MAKVKVKKAEALEMAPDYVPCISFDLEADDLKELFARKLGSTVTLAIKGKLKVVQKGQEYGPKDTAGRITLEGYDVEVASENVFSKLADDSDD